MIPKTANLEWILNFFSQEVQRSSSKAGGCIDVSEKASTKDAKKANALLVYGVFSRFVHIGVLDADRY